MENDSFISSKGSSSTANPETYSSGGGGGGGGGTTSMLSQTHLNKRTNGRSTDSGA